MNWPTFSLLKYFRGEVLSCPSKNRILKKQSPLKKEEPLVSNAQNFSQRLKETHAHKTLLQEMTILVCTAANIARSQRRNTRNSFVSFISIIKVNSDRCTSEKFVWMLRDKWFHTSILKFMPILIIKGEKSGFIGEPHTALTPSVSWIDLKGFWGVCFRDDNGNCVGRCLQALLCNEAPCLQALIS